MPVLFGLIIILILWLRYQIHRSEKISSKAEQSLRNQEHAANFVRKADISNLDYIQIPDTLFAFAPAASINPEGNEDTERLVRLYQQLTDLKTRKILNLTNQTNTELKLAYGIANLDILSACDEYFTKLCRTIEQLGTYYYDHNDLAMARLFFEYAFSIQSDITSGYLLLAKIYKQQNQADQIRPLYEIAKILDHYRASSYLAALQQLEQD